MLAGRERCWKDRLCPTVLATDFLICRRAHGRNGRLWPVAAAAEWRHLHVGSDAHAVRLVRAVRQRVSTSSRRSGPARPEGGYAANDAGLPTVHVALCEPRGAPSVVAFQDDALIASVVVWA